MSPTSNCVRCIVFCVETEWLPLQVITYLIVEGTAIPIYLYVWIMGGNLLHVVYNSVSYCGILYYIISYYTIVCYTLLSVTELCYTMMYSVKFRDGMATFSTYHLSYSRGCGYPQQLICLENGWQPPARVESQCSILKYTVLSGDMMDSTVLYDTVLYETIQYYVILD